jgi:tetratricopeptide (TPR) repeat protein
MDIKNYETTLHNLMKSYSLLMCEYCGVETFNSVSAKLCICSNCESIIVTTKAMLEKKDGSLVDNLTKINRSVGEFKFDDTIALYDKMIAEKKDPSLMYAEAIAYLKYSNYEITQIGYAKPGFMEDNTVHRDRAAKFASTAKKLLTKSISIANAEMAKGNRSLNLVYNRFLAQVKLGGVKGAKESVEILEKMGNEYVYDYAYMVFEARMEKYDNTLKVADKLTKDDNFSVNAFYYIGLALFKKGNMKDAKTVLQSLNWVLKSTNLEALIFEINAQLATT